jgi:hypothetical protein
LAHERGEECPLPAINILLTFLGIRAWFDFMQMPFCCLGIE